MTASLRLDDRLLIVAALLLAGAAITLILHAAGAAESLLGFLYDRLPAGLDLPPDPPTSATGLVSAVSLYGGLAELTAGLVALGVWVSRWRA